MKRQRYARVAQLVERDLAKVEAAGSSPVSRSYQEEAIPIDCKNLIWQIFVCTMREWLSWWSATLPRSRPRVRVPSRALESGPFDRIFCIIEKCFAFSYDTKNPSGQDRTAAERNYIAKAIRRRRGILQSRILSCTGKVEKYLEYF